MITLHLTTRSRQEFINISHDIAKVISAYPQDKKWMINLGGHEESGKSLIALAMDQHFNPDRYDRGLHNNISADYSLDGYMSSRPLQVAFTNACSHYAPDHTYVIHHIKRTCGNARINILSNLHRATEDYDIKSMQKLPNHLDINIDVYKRTGMFVRNIELTVDDPALAEGLQFLEKKYPAKPIVYNPFQSFFEYFGYKNV